MADKEKFDRIARVEVPCFVCRESMHHGERFGEHGSEHHRAEHVVAFHLLPRLAEQDGFHGQCFQSKSSDDLLGLFA